MTRVYQQVRMSRFNLIEVVIALLVVSIALLAIIGLVPIGIMANQKAVSKSYSADAADQILGSLAVYLQDDWSRVKDEHALPSSTPASIAALNTYQAVEAKTNFSHQTMGTMYPITGINGCYRLMQQTTSDTDTHADFDAIARVWKTPTSGWEYGNGGWLEKTDEAFDKRVQVHLELSYPAHLPYSARTKTRYTIEVSRR